MKIFEDEFVEVGIDQLRTGDIIKFSENSRLVPVHSVSANIETEDLGSRITLGIVGFIVTGQGFSFEYTTPYAQSIKFQKLICPEPPYYINIDEWPSTVRCTTYTGLETILSSLKTGTKVTIDSSNAPLYELTL